MNFPVRNRTKVMQIAYSYEYVSILHIFVQGERNRNSNVLRLPRTNIGRNNCKKQNGYLIKCTPKPGK